MSMVLHEKDAVRENLEDDVYASVDLSVSMPKYRLLPRAPGTHLADLRRGLRVSPLSAPHGQ